MAVCVQYSKFKICHETVHKPKYTQDYMCVLFISLSKCTIGIHVLSIEVEVGNSHYMYLHILNCMRLSVVCVIIIRTWRKWCTVSIEDMVELERICTVVYFISVFCVFSACG